MQIMKATHFDTSAFRAGQQFEHWNSVVADAYFSLSLQTGERHHERFCGSLDGGELGHVTVTRLQSDPVSYHRERFHISGENTDYFLVTIPEWGQVHFEQNGKIVDCGPGDFILEGSADPYCFSYQQQARMNVIRVPGAMLRDRIQNADDFCASRFLGRQAGCSLFMEYLQSLIKLSPDLPEGSRFKLSEQLIDLLAMSMETSGEALPCADSASQDAHLHRIYNFINRQLDNPDLNTALIAEHCGISTRYLHQLFKPTGHTVAGWIKERRLKQCYDALSDPRRSIRSIAELAYRWGFSDQAHFSRSFKARYDMPPGQVRAQALDQHKS
ncbi:helix-turn-helix domain-containing protein [Pseudomaricurvus alkylphenolicus]|uniref:AraC-like ligand-binding domain-containing protein n=1 Tax=Pseudomaricurvus alkylphenolicus TaxID=1306991 RepID=UPI001423E80F|nr:helix-turn-helix domain-containing protein [Pseudomaricurvus alkylphenolicus]NIB43666.1 helix-turn-helix domain-containing protein [Pseudomaricurvus alkylphenolicus]